MNANFGVLVIVVSAVLTACSNPRNGQKVDNSQRGGTATKAVAKAAGPFSYPSAVWTESLVPTGTPVKLWRTRANANNSAAAFLFAEKKSAHLVIVSSDGRIVHQDMFAGIIEFQGPPQLQHFVYQGVQYIDEQTETHVMGLERMPSARWLVWHDIQISEGAKGWLYSVYAGGKWEVVYGGAKVASSDWLPIMSLCESGATYGAILRRDQGAVLLFSGKEQALPPAPYGKLRISADGKRFAFFVEQAPGKFALNVDGKLEPRQFDAPGAVKLSPDGSFDDPETIKFSPDGSRLAYVVRIGKDVLGLEQGTTTEIHHPCWPPEFSADSRHIAWSVTQGDGRQAVMVDGRASRSFSGVSRPFLSDDGGQVAFLAVIQRKTHVFRNNADEGMVASAGDIFFDPAGTRWAYQVGTSAKKLSSMRVDHSDGPVFHEGIGDGAFGPDGSRIAYYAFRSGKVVLVVDATTKQTAYDSVIWDDKAFHVSGIFRGLGITRNEVRAFNFAP